MTAPVIEVEGLGKRYMIRRQSTGDRYRTLRDDLTAAAARLFGRNQSGGRLEKVEHWALRDVSFQIQPGDRIGIIGRNGAGKSTLLKLLSRITQPTEGRIRMRGRVASLLEVGTGFHPELTGRENIYFNGALLGMSRSEIDAAFDAIVDFSGVESHLDVPVKRYSSGMYTRLAFSVAAHLEPDILIVDEVLAVGDAGFQRKCIGKMEQIGREGRTVLFVSHNMTALQSLCSTAIELDHGRLIASGSVLDVVTAYLRRQDESMQDRLVQAREAGDGLTVTTLQFSPSPAFSGEDVKYRLSLKGRQGLRIDGLALLIQTKERDRAGIVDLRKSGGYKFDKTCAITIDGTLAALPLVEGPYSIGLYASYDGQQPTLDDLLSLEVLPRQRNTDVVPYPARVRGVVEFDGSFSITEHDK